MNDTRSGDGPRTPSRLHDSADLSESIELKLNMDDVAKQALASVPRWAIEVTCHGKSFNWRGMAPSERQAVLIAVAELSDSEPEFNRYKARVTACVQVAA